MAQITETKIYTLTTIEVVRAITQYVRDVLGQEVPDFDESKSAVTGEQGKNIIHCQIQCGGYEKQEKDLKNTKQKKKPPGVVLQINSGKKGDVN